MSKVLCLSESKFSEILKVFKKSLQYAKETNDDELEGLAHFHIGENLYLGDQDREKARAHLVDF